jgi:hypothetical protein
MPDVPQRSRERKEADPSLVIRRLDAFIAAAEALLEAWDPILEAGGYPTSLPLFDDLIGYLHRWRDSAKEMHTIRTSVVAPLRVSDPGELCTWLDSLQSGIDDAIAAGDDATRPPSQRALGRTMARQKILESRHALRQLLEAARRGVAPATPS